MISVSDCTQVINQLLPEPHAGLMAGILFGTKANLSYEFKQALITTGTIHITALSGMNITIIANLTVTTLLSVFSRKIASLLTILIIIGFILFVGPSASVVRAGIMGCLALLAVVTGRKRKTIYLLIVTVILMIAFRPSYIGELSFQLSVLATLGLVLFASSHVPVQFDEQLAPQPLDTPKAQGSVFFTFIKEDFRTTLAAQIFTVPLLAVQLHQLSLIAPIANVAIGFLIAPLTILGFFLVAVGFILPVLAIPLSWFVWLMLSYLIVVIEHLSQIPFASLRW